MALKPDRVEHLTDLSFFLNEVAERGQFLIVSTAGSGAAINFAKDEVQKGSKVLILRRGTVVTNKIETGISPAGGDIAYYKSDGELTTDVDSTPVGQFLSSKDADGYAKVEINVIPNV